MDIFRQLQYSRDVIGNKHRNYFYNQEQTVDNIPNLVYY